MDAAKLAVIRVELAARIGAVSNHPNRSKANPSEAANPTPQAIRAARMQLGMTQEQAAKLVYSNLRTWQRWEAEVGTPDNKRMHPAIWELWRIKTGYEDA